MGRIAGNQQTAPRRLNDDYSTDPRWVKVLLNHVSLPGQIWEPAAGEGKIVKELRRNGHKVKTSCLSKGHDFLKSMHRSNTIVTNPPYSKANEFILHALNQADTMVCILLGWHLVAGGRERWNTIYNVARPTSVIVIVERMRLDRTTSQFNHAWVVWDKRRKPKKTELIWASIREK